MELCFLISNKLIPFRKPQSTSSVLAMGRPVKKTKQEVQLKEDPFRLQRNNASKSKLKNVSFQQSKKGRFQKSIGNASTGLYITYSILHVFHFLFGIVEN